MAAFESFRAARWIRTANLLLQAVLFLTLVGGINYVAGSHALRHDLTRYRRYSLSPETLAYLKDLESPVRIIVTVAEDDADPELRGLLKEYVYATEANPAGKISVEYLDVYLHPREAEQLDLGPKVGQDSDSVVLISGGNHNALAMRSLFRYDEKGQRIAFQGEEGLTAAILDVSSPVRKTIYFLIGHGELRPDEVDPVRGLSAAGAQLQQRNYRVDTLDLTVTHLIPADASLLVDVAPKIPWAPAEQELLRKYLGANAGRLLLFLAPGTPRLGLESLLSDWAVRVDDDQLRDSGPANVTEDGDLIIRDFAPHPITQGLLSERDGLRIGLARTVRPDPARAAANDIAVVTIAASSTTAWGEVGYGLRASHASSSTVDIHPSPTSDPPDRLGIAVAAERVSARDNLPFSVQGGRLVVIGTGDLISNARIASIGVLDLLLGAVKWTVNQDAQLNIPARPIERFQLSLSARELRNLRICLLLALPGAAALLGIAVYWTRRR